MDNILLKDILGRVLTWPEKQQRRLVDFALSIEAVMKNLPHQASSAELEAIDAAVESEPASEEEINLARGKLRGL